MIKVISSIQQIEEMSSVFLRPKLKVLLDRNQISEFFTLFLKTVEIVESKVRIDACRDEKDNFILEAAVSGNADFIITEDNDLLTLNPYKKLRIVTMKEFYKNVLIK